MAYSVVTLGSLAATKWVEKFNRLMPRFTLLQHLTRLAFHRKFALQVNDIFHGEVIDSRAKPREIQVFRDRGITQAGCIF
jgi:hypothetical protein